MKKLLLLLIVSVIGIYSVNAQDLIVTSEGDSINCKITKEKENNLYFTFKHGEEVRNTLLPMNQVSSHQYNFYPGTVTPELTRIRSNEFPRWRMALNGGFSKHTAEISKEVSSSEREYVEDLLSGSNFSADVNYYFSESIGAGMKYLKFNSTTDVQTNAISSEPVDLNILFIGPGVSTRLLNASKKNALLFNISIGYIDYKFDGNAALIKGKTAGLLYDLGYDIGISENISIGLQVSYLSGQLTQFEMVQGAYTETVELEKGNYESLHRLDFSVGLRLNL